MLSSPLVSSQAEIRRRFRMRFERRDALSLPGAANALTARIIEDLGFEAVYVTGAGLANTHLGMPDLGLVCHRTCASMVRISDVCRLPLVVDIDNRISATPSTCIERSGYSNGLVPPPYRSKTRSSRKKCGHFAGKSIVPLPEMLGRSRLRLMRVAMRAHSSSRAPTHERSTVSSRPSSALTP